MTKFKVGDIVAVCCHRETTGYEHTNNKIGHIVSVKTYTKCDKTYYRIYVDLSPLHNPAQEQGLFIFKKEELMLLKEVEPPTRANDFEMLWTCEFSTDCMPNIKIKEEKKEMELLELYFNRKRDELEIKYREKREKIKRKDVMYAEVMDLRKKYAHIAEFSIYVADVYKFSTEIENEIIKIDRECDKKLDELYYQRQEIKAQLDICETYEQKMNVLKAYGVIDEQGKLNK